MRKVTRDIDEEVRDRVRALANTEAFQQSRRERKKVEMLFAHMKRILKLDRLRLRGLSGARDEVLLVATCPELEKTRQVCRTTTADGASSLRCVSLARVLEYHISAADPSETAAEQVKHHALTFPKANQRAPSLSFATQSVKKRTSPNCDAVLTRRIN